MLEVGAEIGIKALVLSSLSAFNLTNDDAEYQEARARM